jgi:methylamine--corrinoid protein Co-methyltransferase
MEGIVRHREIDIFEGGSLITIFGQPVRAGSPYETLVGAYNAQLTKEALWRAGRPGMPTIGIISGTTAFGQLGGFGIKGGLDPDTDMILMLTPGDLKTSYTSLHKIAHAINCGAKIQAGMSSMIGGYTGPPEGAVLSQIANTLLQLRIHEYHTCIGSIYDSRYGGNCGREGQWASSVAYQAVSRNTNVLRFTTMNQKAGPCTEMLLYESAVAMVNASVSGLSSVVIPRSGGGKYADYLTPLECKFCAEVFKGSAGMTRKQANEIAKVLIPKYEEHLLRSPKGKSFQECYDLKTLEPTKEWLDIYLKVKKELIELGVPLQ